MPAQISELFCQGSGHLILGQEWDQIRVRFDEHLNVAILIIRLMVFPATKHDPLPLKCESTDDFLIGMPFCPPHYQIGFRPTRLLCGTAGKLVERLFEEFRARPAHEYNLRLATGSCDGCNAAKLLDVSSIWKFVAVGSERRCQPRRQRCSSSRKGDE